MPRAYPEGMSNQTDISKKRLGRPPGKKNLVATYSATDTHKRRGRPPGRKNSELPIAEPEARMQPEREVRVEPKMLDMCRGALGNLTEIENSLGRIRAVLFGENGDTPAEKEERGSNIEALVLQIAAKSGTVAGMVKSVTERL